MRIIAALVTVLSVSATQCVYGDALSARQMYANAVHVMMDLPQPQYVVYQLQAQSDGLQVDLANVHGQVWLNVHPGSGGAHWLLRHRTYDYQSQITNMDNGTKYVSQRSFFDPTWYGAMRALRQGMFGSQDPAAPRPDTSPSPPPDVPLKTIAVVAVMGPGIYDVEDRGSAACPSGDQGEALHLTSRIHDSQHQLSDVIVDLHSMRFCMMRFSTAAGVGFHGIMEEYYGDVGGYWMQTGGLLDGTFRLFGIATRHGTWRYTLSDMAFPRSLPEETFAQKS